MPKFKQEIYFVNEIMDPVNLVEYFKMKDSAALDNKLSIL